MSVLASWPRPSRPCKHGVCERVRVSHFLFPRFFLVKCVRVWARANERRFVGTRGSSCPRTPHAKSTISGGVRGESEAGVSTHTDRACCRVFRIFCCQQAAVAQGAAEAVEGGVEISSAWPTKTQAPQSCEEATSTTPL